jgi:cytochrome P450
MLRLVQHPQIAARVRADPSLIERFAEESLRYESAVQSNFRCLTADTEFHGRRMHKGALVLVSWGAANQDPAQFADPSRFDIDRPAFRTHHSFGGGIHACAGAALARQELVESYALLLRRLDNLRLQLGLTLDDVQRTGGIVSHGVARLPIRFDVIGA